RSNTGRRFAALSVSSYKAISYPRARASCSTSARWFSTVCRSLETRRYRAARMSFLLCFLDLLRPRQRIAWVRGNPSQFNAHSRHISCVRKGYGKIFYCDAPVAHNVERDHFPLAASVGGTATVPLLSEVSRYEGSLPSRYVACVMDQ